MNLDVEKSLAPFVTADATDSVTETLTKLRNENKDFILVTKENVPVSVIRESALMRLAAQPNQKLGQLLEQLPPMFILDEGELADEDLCDVLTTLGSTQSPGFVIRRLDNSIGIVSRASVARAVPLEDIAFVGPNRASGGPIGVPARTYICRKCIPTRRKRTRIAGPPNCDIWSHGPMQEE